MLFSARFNQKSTLRCCFLLVLIKNYIAMLFSTRFRVKTTLQCSFASGTLLCNTFMAPLEGSWRRRRLRGASAALHHPSVCLRRHLPSRDGSRSYYFSTRLPSTGTSATAKHFSWLPLRGAGAAGG